MSWPGPRSGVGGEDVEAICGLHRHAVGFASSKQLQRALRESLMRSHVSGADGVQEKEIPDAPYNAEPGLEMIVEQM